MSLTKEHARKIDHSELDPRETKWTEDMPQKGRHGWQTSREEMANAIGGSGDAGGGDREIPPLSC